MHQELDAHGLPGIRRHVHRLVDPRLPIQALMEDRLQNAAGAIGNVSILPVERDAVGGIVPVPETQCTSTSRHRELLIKRAVPSRLRARDVAGPRGMRPTVRLLRGNDRIVIMAVN